MGGWGGGGGGGGGGGVVASTRRNVGVVTKQKGGRNSHGHCSSADQY